MRHFLFVALDIFKNYLQNKGVDKDNELEAWLTFLSVDDPKWILELIEVYPKFKELYLEVYKACRNTEAMMGLFSEELLEMDKNTVDFMIDEMQDTIDAQKAELDSQANLIAEQKTKLDAKDELIAQLQRQLAEKQRK